MATKTYRALRQGYVDGRVIDEGEVFTTESVEIVREEPEGDKKIGAIVRNKDGTAKTKPADAPSWAVEISQKEAIAQAAADPDNTDDPNFDAMSKSALQAYAAERNVVFTASTSKEDLITAIKAAADPLR